MSDFKSATVRYCDQQNRSPTAAEIAIIKGEWIQWAESEIAALRQKLEQAEMRQRPEHSLKYKHCNHHHELTEDHQLVDFGHGEFVANKDAVPLLSELHRLGLRTRTHHVDDHGGFISILLDDGVDIEVRRVRERDADRTQYNGQIEVLLRWFRKPRVEKEEG